MSHFSNIILFIILIKIVGSLQNSYLFSRQKSAYALIPCEDDTYCEDVGGKCINNFCKCQESSICKEPAKHRINKLGEECYAIEDCNIEKSECNMLENKCKCISGTVPSRDSRRCLEVSSGVGGSCEESVQCYNKTPHSRCQENKCICQQHMHDHNGSCYINVDLGGKCLFNEDCSLIQFSTCSDSKCICNEKYVSNGTQCLQKARRIKSPCVDNLQCTSLLGDASECHYGHCECKELYQLKTSSQKCVRDKLLDETCGVHKDCHQPGMGDRLECIEGKCKCRSFYYPDSGYCISSSNSTVVYRSLLFFFVTIVLVI